MKSNRLEGQNEPFGAAMTLLALRAEGVPLATKDGRLRFKRGSISAELAALATEHNDRIIALATARLHAQYRVFRADLSRRLHEPAVATAARVVEVEVVDLYRDLARRGVDPRRRFFAQESKTPDRSGVDIKAAAYLRALAIVVARLEALEARSAFALRAEVVLLSMAMGWSQTHAPCPLLTVGAP